MSRIFFYKIRIQKFGLKTEVTLKCMFFFTTRKNKNVIKEIRLIFETEFLKNIHVQQLFCFKIQF